MPRNTESSYRKAVDYVKQLGRPASINDMLAANIMSKATAYRLFRPEMFAQAAMYGLFPINDHKPHFFVYDADKHAQMLTGGDKEKLADLKNHREVMRHAVEVIQSNAVILSDLERKIVTVFRQHVELTNIEDALKENFTRPSLSLDSYFDILVNAETLTGKDLDKLRTLLISLFVSSFNTSEDE